MMSHVPAHYPASALRPRSAALRPRAAEAERAHAAICEQVKVAVTVVPLALFFRTDADREELVAAVIEAKPGMIAKRRPR
jgi:hypothetical protein